MGRSTVGIVVTPTITIPLDEISIQFARSGGPGGQNVNKVNTKAQLRWNPRTSPALPPAVLGRFLEKFASRITADGSIQISCQRHRQADRNRDECLDRLRDLILTVIEPPKIRRPTRPSRGSIQRRLDDKKARSSRKRDRRTPADG